MSIKKLVAAAAIALMFSTTQAGAETLRIGSETVYPPLNSSTPTQASMSVLTWT